MARFMLLAARRSGTSFLMSALNGHPQVQCHKSVFHRRRLLRYLRSEKPGTPFYVYRSASVKRQMDHIFCRRELIGAFLTELYASGGSSKAVVVRIAYPHEYPEALTWALENDIGVIHLIRTDYLRSIAYYLASETRPTIHVSPDVLKRHLTERLQQVERYRSMFSNGQYCKVSDESLVANRETESRRLLEFLAVDSSIPLTFGRRKKAPELKEILENYDEAVRAFKGTSFERYLYTSLPSGELRGLRE